MRQLKPRDLDVATRRWVSIDVTLSYFKDAHHVRLTLGTDYKASSPTRGLRQGGGEESMTVVITIALG